MYPVPYNPVYGIFVHEQVKALAKAGVELRVVSPVPWTPWPLGIMSKKWRGYSEAPVRDEVESIPVYYPRYLTYPRAWSFASSGERMYKGIREIVSQIRRDFHFDLIHAHVALPDGYAASILAEEYGCPLVVTIHGYDFQKLVHRDLSCRKAIGLTIAKASSVFPVSSKLQKIGKEIFPESEGKFFVTPNGINPDDFNYPVPVSDSKLANGPKILSVSNLIYSKGIDLNIWAIHVLKEKYPDITYFIIGDGYHRKKLQRLTERLELENAVSFLGNVEHKEVFRNMSECDIFSLPSWNEAFGVVYIEAMACGKPVIGCLGEGIEDFVENGVNGLLVEPHNVDDLVEKLDYLLSHTEEAKKMGEKARELVLEKYTWENNAKQTIKVYQESLAKQP